MLEDVTKKTSSTLNSVYFADARRVDRMIYESNDGREEQ